MDVKDATFEISILAGVKPDKISIEADEVVVGRTFDCAVAIKHRNVSRSHLIIRRLDDQITVEDLGSSFGTSLAGVKLVPNQRKLIKSGDELILGSEVRIRIEMFISEAKAADDIQIPAERPTDTLIATRPPAFFKESVESSPGFPAPNMSRLPEANDLADEIVKDAQKQAAVIIREAEAAGEEKVQSFYKRARETEEKANQFYRQRLHDAHQEADRAYEAAKTKGQQFTREAREQSQALRDRTEEFVAEMENKAQTKVQELLHEAEEQSREVRARKLREADEYLKEREGQIASEIRNGLKNEINKHETDMHRYQVESEKAVAENKRLALEIEDETKKLELTRAHVAKMAADVARFEIEAKEAVVRHSALMKDAEEHVKLRDRLKNEVESLTTMRKTLSEDVDLRREEIAPKLQAIKVEFEDQRAKLQRAEQEKIDQLKLESVRTAQKFEKELFLEIQSNQNRFGREILLVTEALLKPKLPAEFWRATEAELSRRIHQILTSSTSGAAKNASQALPDLSRARSQERTRQMLSGLVMGGLLTVSAFYAFHFYQNAKSPMQTELASERERQKQDLENRKYDPPQTDQLQDSYVDCVLFTKGYARRYLDPNFQVTWTKALSLYLYKTFQLDEDKSLKAIARIDAMIKTLEERKASIHPDFVKQDIEKLREIEKTTMAEVATDLGSQVRLEAFKKFERQFLTQAPSTN
jgi:pSer/pThr/pTyr-binding forkhead associated (FHA) protein